MAAKISRLTYLFAFLFFLNFSLSISTSAQSKSELEKQKQENLKKIKEAEKILNQTKNRKEATLGQLSALNNQIQASQDLILTVNQEISILDNEIGELGSITSALQRDLDKLKAEYAEMVYESYKANKGFSKLTFLFSSATFNQLFRRLNWMEQYSEARRMQVEQITKVREALENQQAAVKAKRQEQKGLLDQQLTESQKLLALQKEQNSVVQQLALQESKIQKDIAERRNSLRQLDALIAKLVREEIEKARAEAEAEARKNKTATAKASAAGAVPMTPEASAMSTSFEGTRTKLLWPVSSGFVSTKFGKHQVYKQVKLESSGVEIQTKENEEVRAVFDGQVRRVFFMPGMNNVVMVQHGNYFTVYARLKEVKVEPLQNIKAKDVLGTVYTNNDGISELHFEIWKNNQKLDPEDWLFKN